VCRHVADGVCVRLTSAADLPFAGGDGEWLDYPSDGLHTNYEHDVMIEALGSADPARTAAEYYLVSRGRRPDAPWTVQFWFFYTFNYQPVTLRATASWIPKPLRSRLVVRPKIARSGYHEGDFESVSLLLSARTHRPVYAWMARHKDEGRAYVWGEPGLQSSGRHLTVFAAKGSHTDYASCVSQPRPVAPLGIIDDQPQCTLPKQLRLRPETTHLIDLSRVSWACWRGYFGQIPEQVRARLAHQSDNGPLSPLWQQKLGGVTSQPCRGLSRSVSHDDQREEMLDDGAAARLRVRAGRLDPVVDECADWEHPPARGILLIACDPRQLGAFRASGYESPGPPTLHIDVTDPSQPETGHVTVPALRRDATRSRLDAWQLATVSTTTTEVYAACALKRRNWAVQAHFTNVRIVRGHPMRIVDGPTAWRLVADNGRTFEAQPRRVPPPDTNDDPTLKTRCAA
jgi:hypothetical protein